ncbi:hypothetical protein D3C79_623760 [compost metagenome]
MLLVEFADMSSAAADQGVWRQLREPGGEQLFVTVTQALWLVDHQRAFHFGSFQNVGCIDVFSVERRIFAHQDHVQILQRQILLAAKAEPALFIFFHVQQARAGTAITGMQIEIVHLHIMQFPAAALRFEQHGEAGVFLDIDGGDRVHHDAELDHLFSLRTCEDRSLAQVAETDLQSGNCGERGGFCTQNAWPQQDISKSIVCGHGNFFGG